LPATKPTPTTKKQSTKRLLQFFLALAITGLLILLYQSKEGNSAPREIAWNELITEMIIRKQVSKIQVVNGEQALIFLKKKAGDSTSFQKLTRPGNLQTTDGAQYFLSIASAESFERKLDEAQKNVPLSEQVPVSYLTTSKNTWDPVLWMIPFLILLIALRYSAAKAAGGDRSLFSFGKSNAAFVDTDTISKVTFNDVAGLEEAEQEVREVVDFLKSPGRFTSLGAKIPKGIILVGPPGTGKTLLAKAVAGEAGVPFFSMSGSEFVEMFVGVGASRVRDLFKQAKEKTPSIVFIDEIDAIGRSRGKSAFFVGSNDERESTLNQLLKEMDGFESNSGVIVLAATNRADILDSALLRPGRFDRHIYLELPNKQEREAIFKVHIRPLKLDTGVDIPFLAAQTPGFSGADIANVCNEAALIAARNNQQNIGIEQFNNAIDRIVAGLEKRSKMISPAEKNVIAYHEAGHALISWRLKHVDPLIKISIIPRGKTLGAAWYLPEEKQLRTKSEFEEHLCATLGGRAAETIVFGEPSSGALDDLEKVTKEAYMMVAYFGFSTKIGAISFYDSTSQRDTGLVKPYSEETARVIDEEVRNLVNEAYEHSKEILHHDRDTLDKLAALLLQKETLYKEELESVLGRRASQPVERFP